MSKADTANLERYAKEQGLEVHTIEPMTTSVEVLDPASIDHRLDERTASLIAGTVQLLQANLGLRDYEVEHLAFVLSEPNFFEFWFSSTPYGSIKVHLDGKGIPYVYDQIHNRALIPVIQLVNAKLKALFA